MTTEQTWTHPDRAEEHGLTVPGPWDDEPDKVQWVDEVTDLDCLAVRNHSGAWCGYVGLLSGHPALDHDFLYGEVSVHGGITYGPRPCDGEAPEGHGICHVPLPGRPADVEWTGFDCGHAWDIRPGTLRYYEPFDGAIYRDLAYVKAEVSKLAEQLASRV